MSSWSPTKYKTKNWPSYNAALNQRGSLSIWFDPEMIWEPPPSGKRGRQQGLQRRGDPDLFDLEGAVWHAAQADDRVCREPFEVGRTGLCRARL